jgi:ribonuclease J
MNCMAIEQDGAIVLLDCGVMFPFRELGVDVIHPDFGYLLERRQHLRGIVLTHGHEDHIGATPYLLKQIPLPVYGPPYALQLLKHRLKEVAPEHRPELHRTVPGGRFELGPFGFEPFRVTHSIPDSTGLIIDTAVGTVVHTGDFNIDEQPVDGQHFDARRLREVGERGVRLLLSDSTNIGVPGVSGREQDVQAKLSELVASAPQRVVVSLFASNLHRFRSALAAARDSGRKVCLLGRSLQTHARLGTDLGYLDAASLLVPPERARKIPRHELMVLATGTQGEAPAALSRLARGNHPDLDLHPGDQILLSSRIIPGHEQTVFTMINEFERRGIEVVHRGIEPAIHVSGHACRDEQQRMLEWVRPQAFLPVHGTYHHLRRHAELASGLGVEHTLITEDGGVVEVQPDGPLQLVESVPVGRVHVDAGEAIPDEVLRDRALLAELGMAVVIVQVRRDGQLAGPPEIVTRGVVHEETEEELLGGARQYVADDLQDPGRHGPGFDEEELRDQARRALRRFFGRRLGRKPLTYAVVVQVP